MKKLITFICLLFFFIADGAPEITSEFLVINYNAKPLYRPIDEKNKKEFLRYIEDLGFFESTNDWTKINSIDCIGEWQFSPITLKHLGYDVNPDEFRNDPSIFPRKEQINALRNLMKQNEYLINQHKKYIGKKINGIRITRSGLHAGSHLGGFGSVRDFLMSNGEIDRADANGTKISHYIDQFASYNFVF